MRRLGTSATVSALLLVAACASEADHVVEYTPPQADVVNEPNCLAPDIISHLTSPEGSQASNPDVIPGYIPTDFNSVAVVKCEIGVDSLGGITIDSVRLEGDIEHATDIFRIKSKHYSDSPTCSEQPEPPAAIWFVNEGGQAVRAWWPTEPCGYVEEPLEVLKSLHETGRSRTSIGGSSEAASPCPPLSGSFFPSATTSRSESGQGSGGTTQLPGGSLASPIDDVGELQVCRYRMADGEPSFVSSVRLNRQESVQFARSVAVAPIAPSCSAVTGEIAKVDLLRPDGSGGTSVVIELDGCFRATFDGFRQLDPDQLGALSRE